MNLVKTFEIDPWEVSKDKMLNFLDMVTNFLALAYEETLNDDCEIFDYLNDKEVSESAKKEIKEKYEKVYLKLYDALDDILWALVNDGYLGEGKDD